MPVPVTENVLLRQRIVANPDDDVLRLEYADWLDEQPEEMQQVWAKFIRQQVALETVRVPEDVLEVTRVEAILDYPQMKARQTPEPGRCLVAVAKRHAGVVYAKGFFEEVHCPADVWAQFGHELAADHPIRAVLLTPEPGGITYTHRMRRAVEGFQANWPHIRFVADE